MEVFKVLCADPVMWPDAISKQITKGQRIYRSEKLVSR